MADDTEVKDEIEEVEQIEDESDTEEAEKPTTEPETPEDAKTDDVVVTIGEETPPSEVDNRAPEWVRELRKASREKDRRIRELEEKLQVTAPQTESVVVGTKPKLEDCDYDADRFERELESWHQQKQKADAAANTRKQEAEAEKQAWQARLDGYGKAKTELKVSDYDDAEAVTQDLLSVTQQGVILSGSDNPALIVYALGRNPKKAKELASITDPVKFAFAVAKLETQLKVTSKKATPAPEKTLPRGTASAAGGSEGTLDKLRADALKTGDATKLMAYKAQLRAAKK